MAWLSHPLPFPESRVFPRTCRSAGLRPGLSAHSWSLLGRGGWTDRQDRRTSSLPTAAGHFPELQPEAAGMAALEPGTRRTLRPRRVLGQRGDQPLGGLTPLSSRADGYASSLWPPAPCQAQGSVAGCSHTRDGPPPEATAPQPGPSFPRSPSCRGSGGPGTEAVAEHCPPPVPPPGPRPLAPGNRQCVPSGRRFPGCQGPRRPPWV